MLRVGINDSTRPYLARSLESSWQNDPASDLPAEARPVLTVIAESLQSVQAKVAVLDREIAARAKANPVAKRLMTIPGIGPVVATALVAIAPAASTLRRSRSGTRASPWLRGMLARKPRMLVTVASTHGRSTQASHALHELASAARLLTTV